MMAGGFSFGPLPASMSPEDVLAAFGRLPRGFTGQPTLGLPEGPSSLPELAPQGAAGMGPLSFGPLPGAARPSIQAMGGTIPLPPQRPDGDALMVPETASMADRPAPGAQVASGQMPPLSFGPLPGQQPRPSANGGGAGEIQDPSIADSLTGAFGRFRANGGGDLLTSLGMGLLSKPRWDQGIAAGLQNDQDQRAKRSVSDLARAEYGLKVAKLAKEQAGGNATISLLVSKGYPQAEAEAMVQAAAAGNSTALTNALNNAIPRVSEPSFGWVKRPDGSFAPAPGGPEDPAYKRNVSQATAEGAAAGKPDEPFNLSPGQTRYDATGKPIVSAGPQKPEGFDSEMKLRNEFNKNLGTFADVHDGYGRVIAATKQRETNPGSVSPASDISLIFGYMKMLDPGSVVREGEYATAKNAAGVPDRVVNAYNKALNGEFLTDAQRRDFLGQAAGLYGTARKTAEGVAERYRGLANQYGIDPDRSVYLPEQPSPPNISQGRTRGGQADPATTPTDPLAIARDAIARGASREKVLNRLLQNGIDPKGL